MFKDVAGQKLAVFAWDAANGAAKTGDAAQITGQISKDGAATAATNDANPTELDATDAPGVYLFDMTQAETNADLIVLQAASSTADIEFRPVIIYTKTAAPTVAEILAGTVEGTLELKQSLQAIFSFCAGLASGGGTAQIKYRDHADTKNRITETVNANGNRTAVTLDLD